MMAKTQSGHFLRIKFKTVFVHHCNIFLFRFSLQILLWILFKYHNFFSVVAFAIFPFIGELAFFDLFLNFFFFAFHSIVSVAVATFSYYELVVKSIATNFHFFYFDSYSRLVVVIAVKLNIIQQYLSIHLKNESRRINLHFFPPGGRTLSFFLLEGSMKCKN